MAPEPPVADFDCSDPVVDLIIFNLVRLRLYPNASCRKLTEYTTLTITYRVSLRFTDHPIIGGHLWPGFCWVFHCPAVCGTHSPRTIVPLVLFAKSCLFLCETLGCGKSSSISATEVKESSLFWVEFSSFIAIEKE
jgi:hypothetical protein